MCAHELTENIMTEGEREKKKAVILIQLIFRTVKEMALSCWGSSGDESLGICG